MAAFTQPTPPIDFRRDIEAFNLYHEKCTTKPIKETVAHLLYALENTEPIVDRTSTVYTTFRNAMVVWKTRIDKKHDADANRWYFHRIRRQFRAVEHVLYGTTSDLDSDGGGDTNDENSEDEDQDDESPEDAGSEVDSEKDDSDVAQSASSTDTHTDISTRIDEARDNTVAEKAPDMPSPKTKTKPSARTTRFSQRLKDLDALRAREEENMHHSARRGKGKEFKGRPVDPEKAHLDIGERELAGHDDVIVITERESNVRVGTEQNTEEDESDV
ncbi:uncharacterized protein J4E84_009361 [Alternaria hordeiaustralica]|uniref:uncharacterized protein n=1 Tax=Alternaria hordeiaustralica TaxID=1187925 RepID=UPI0020C35372|nr:uncharacterized protein J4E84_009361 [Alternaria hordeiaustralica]KAI4676767.1 hypothetical protein J4E84_009361 [Alternaria hordeiaustralica]